MNIYVLIALAVFANYRISRMLALEDGPRYLFLEARGKVFETFGNGWLNDGVNCPLCVGYWSALGLTLVLAILTPISIVEAILMWHGIAGASTFLFRSE